MIAIVPHAYRKFSRSGHFWSFHVSRHVALFRVAGVALRDMWTSLVPCRKSFFRGRPNTISRRFQNMRCIFRGRRRTLDVSSFIVRRRSSTSDESSSVFFANRIGRAARSGDKVKIAWQVWHFVRYDEIWRKPRAKHRF